MAFSSRKTKDIKSKGEIKSKKPLKLCIQSEQDFLADFDDSVSSRKLFKHLYILLKHIHFVECL